jgi:multiple sugar transport system substrate-binding protein
MFRNLLRGSAIAAVSLLAASTSFAAEITLWIRADGAAFMPPLVEAFNAQGEDKVTLEIIPAAQLLQKYATALAGGSAPDALSLDLIFTPSLAEKGQLEDMTAWAKSLPYFDALSPAHVSVGTYQDKIYGLPFAADASILLWNKDLFAEAGLDPEAPPKTWAEIESFAEAINDPANDTYGYYFSGSCGGCGIFTFTPFVWAGGGEIMSADGKSVMLDSPQLRSAMELHRGMVEKGLLPEGAASDPGSNFLAFQNGNIGIQALGAFAIGVFAGNADLNYGVTLIPNEDGTAASSFLGGENLVVTKGTAPDKIAVVQKFLEFAYTPERQAEAAKLGSLPVRTDIADEALAGLDARYAEAAKAVAIGRTPYSTVFNELFNDPNGPYAQFMADGMFGDDLDAAIAAAQEDMQAIVDSAN